MEEEVNELDILRGHLIPFCIAQYESFVFPKHVQLIADHLEQIERGEITRLMIFAPPRHGKSELISKLFPLWYIGRNSKKIVGVATYSQELSNEIGLSLNQRMNSEVFQEVFPDAKPVSESNAIKKTQTISGGGFFVVGVGGSITGRGAHLRILDDPNKGREDADSDELQEKQWRWWTSVWYTRGEKDIQETLTDEDRQAPIVIVLTRWSDKDIAKRLIDKEKEDGENGDKWTILDLEAICENENDPLGRPVVPDPEDTSTWKNEHALWPEKFNAKELANIRLAIGPSDWNALFQQRPSSARGNLFLKDKWKFYDTLPKGINRPVQSWDMNYKETKTSDFLVGLTGAKFKSSIYLIDRVKGRMTFPKAVEAFKRANLKHPTSTAKYVEAKANGQPIIDTLSNEISGITSVDPDTLGSKNARWEAAAKYQQAGCIYLPKGEPWVDDFIENMSSVPNGKYDDDADALAMLVLLELGQPSLDALLEIYEAELLAAGIEIDVDKLDSKDPYKIYMDLEQLTEFDDLGAN